MQRVLGVISRTSWGVTTDCVRKVRSAKCVLCLAALHTSCSASGCSLQRGLTDTEPARRAQVFAAERDGAIEKPDQSGGFQERETNMFSEKSGDPKWKLVRKGTAPAFAPQNMRSVEPCCLLSMHGHHAKYVQACFSCDKTFSNMSTVSSK